MSAATPRAKPGRQTLANTHSSHIPDHAWMSFQREQERRAAEMMNGGYPGGGGGAFGGEGDDGFGSSERDTSEERGVGLW